jgi:predicted CoA-binding protein
VEGLRAYPSIRDIPADLDAASLYVPPKVGIQLLDEIADKQVKELYVNPGAESDELLERAKALGLNTIVACSIMAVGMRPEEV